MRGTCGPRCTPRSAHYLLTTPIWKCSVILDDREGFKVITIYVSVWSSEHDDCKCCMRMWIIFSGLIHYGTLIKFLGFEQPYSWALRHQGRQIFDSMYIHSIWLLENKFGTASRWGEVFESQLHTATQEPEHFGLPVCVCSVLPMSLEGRGHWLKWGGMGGSAPCSHLSPPCNSMSPLIESIKCYFMPK